LHLRFRQKPNQFHIFPGSLNGRTADEYQRFGRRR
jgi:hypothetical protein